MTTIGIPRMLRVWLALAFCLLWLPVATARAQSVAAIPPLDAPVVDTTGTLSADEIARLSQRARDLQQRKGSQLQILIVPSTQPEDIAQYAQRAFDQWKLGRAEVDDGVLLLVAKDDRRARIHTGYGLEGAIPDITAGRVIQEYLVPKFRAGDFYGGLDEASAALVKLIDGEALPAPMAPQPGGEVPGSAFFALFVAYIAATVVRGLFGSAASGVRGLSTGLAAGGVAWWLSSFFGLGVFAGVLGLVYGLIRVPRGRYARHGGWGGIGGGSWGSSSGSSSGGGWGGSSGGGWSGGGGSSGGGGASGSW